MLLYHIGYFTSFQQLIAKIEDVKTIQARRSLLQSKSNFGSETVSATTIWTKHFDVPKIICDVQIFFNWVCVSQNWLHWLTLHSIWHEKGCSFYTHSHTRSNEHARNLVSLNSVTITIGLCNKCNLLSYCFHIQQWRANESEYQLMQLLNPWFGFITIGNRV